MDIFFKTIPGFTGDAVPVTGLFFNSNLAKSMSLLVRATGVGAGMVINVQAPFVSLSDSTVTTQSISITTDGYSYFNLSGVPIPKIRLATNGTGYIWSEISQRN